MTDKPAFTRREFIGNGAMIVSTMATVPLFLERSAWALTPATGSAVKDRPGVPGERILVVVQMTGGNDGINTVVPFGITRPDRASASRKRTCSSSTVTQGWG